MTALITGVCGFVGHHLARHLLDSGEQVFGTYLDLEDRRRIGDLEKHVALMQGDVRDPHKMGMVLRKTRPDAIYHLAAQASVPLSLSKPVMTIDVNVTGTAGLLEAVKRESPDTPVFFPSSSDVYGLVHPRDVPIRETHPPAPRNPYAASKLAAEEICRQYVRAYDLKIVMTRSFNHTGPGQATGFVVPDFASQIARLERGTGKAELKVGNLNARRDLSDVRDIVRGYRLILQKGKPGEVYHLGSGKAVRISAVLKQLVALSARPVNVVADPTRQRPSDLPLLAASLAKTRRRIGWKAEIPLAVTLADTLEYWRRYGDKK